MIEAVGSVTFSIKPRMYQDCRFALSNESVLIVGHKVYTVYDLLISHFAFNFLCDKWVFGVRYSIYNARI